MTGLVCCSRSGGDGSGGGSSLFLFFLTIAHVENDFIVIIIITRSPPRAAAVHSDPPPSSVRRFFLDRFFFPFCFFPSSLSRRAQLSLLLLIRFNLGERVRRSNCVTTTYLSLRWSRVVHDASSYGKLGSVRVYRLIKPFGEQKILFTRVTGILFVTKMGTPTVFANVKKRTLIAGIRNA